MISHGANANITPDTTSTARTSLYDLYPTLFDLTGLNAAIPPANPIDGVSIRAAIEGDPFQRGLLYWHYPHRSNQDQFSAQINGGAFVSAVSNENWKLIFFYEDRHYELYNLTSDPSETTNLLSFNPGIGHDLSQALNNYLVSVGAQMPVKIATNLPEPAPQILSAPLPGDYDGDSFVTLADYTRWKSDFGSATLLCADGNGNGVVDAADYVVWRNLFSGSGSGSGSLAGVPEPSSALLFMLSLAGAAIAARKRRR